MIAMAVDVGSCDVVALLAIALAMLSMVYGPWGFVFVAGF